MLAPWSPVTGLAAAGIFACGSLLGAQYYLEAIIPYNRGGELEFLAMASAVGGLGLLLSRWTHTLRTAVRAGAIGAGLLVTSLALGGAAPLSRWRWEKACEAGDACACVLAMRWASNAEALYLTGLGCKLRRTDASSDDSEACDAMDTLCDDTLAPGDRSEAEVEVASDTDRPESSALSELR